MSKKWIPEPPPFPEGLPSPLDLQRTLDKSTPRRPRTRLSPSMIGGSCLRKIWYDLRRVRAEEISARMTRLYAHGDREEVAMVEVLTSAGITVKERQLAVTALDGHFYGKIDGIGEIGKHTFLIEIKSYNDKRFKTLVSKGVKVSDPEYNVQMQVYMNCLWLERALFCAVNKNDNDLHFEWVEYDQPLTSEWMDKCSYILGSVTPPERVTDDPKSFHCRFCTFSGICHEREAALPSCRSCRHHLPVEQGKWKCAIGKGDALCPEWHDITAGDLPVTRQSSRNWEQTNLL